MFWLSAAGTIFNSAFLAPWFDFTFAFAQSWCHCVLGSGRTVSSTLCALVLFEGLSVQCFGSPFSCQNICLITPFWWGGASRRFSASVHQEGGGCTFSRPRCEGRHQTAHLLSSVVCTGYFGWGSLQNGRELCFCCWVTMVVCLKDQQERVSCPRNHH